MPGLNEPSNTMVALSEILFSTIFVTVILLPKSNERGCQPLSQQPVDNTTPLAIHKNTGINGRLLWHVLLVSNRTFDISRHFTNVSNWQLPVTSVSFLAGYFTPRPAANGTKRK